MRALAVLLSICIAAPAQAALPSLPPDGLFNVLTHPLTHAQEVLLANNKYEIHPDGSVVSPEGLAVAEADMPYLLTRMGSAQRLKAFVQLDILLTNSDGERHLSPGEREDLRKIVRENWPYFSLTTRKDFRTYFTIEELEKMNVDPPVSEEEDAPFLGMKDPAPAATSEREMLAAAPPAAVAAAASPLPDAAAPASAASYFPPVLEPLSRPLPLPSSGAAAPAQPQPAAAPPAAPQAALAQALAALLAAVTPAAPAAPAPAVPASAPPAPDLDKPAPKEPAADEAEADAAPAAPTPAAPVTPAPVAPAAAQTIAMVSAPPPAALPAAAAPSTPPSAPPRATVAATAHVAAPPVVSVPQQHSVRTQEIPNPATLAVASSIPQAPGLDHLIGKPAAPPTKQAPIVAKVSTIPSKPRAITPDDFEKFLVDAPYDKDEKDLLRTISQKAPAFARDRALALVIDVMPQIVYDSLRAGLERRAALLVYETSGEDSYTIALNPDAVLYKRKRVFFGESVTALPDAPKAYGAMHLGAPPVQAVNPLSVPVKELDDDWGHAKVFSDESERARYSQFELAGVLLRKLLLLDAHRQGWDASPYTADVYARVAQMMLYARVFREYHEDAFLDPDLRGQFRLWLDHPWEYRDYLAHTLSSGRVGTLDLRKDGSTDILMNFATQARWHCPGSADDEAAAKTAAEHTADSEAALAMANAGLTDDATLQTAQAEIASQPALPKAPANACAQNWLDLAAGARQAAALRSEMELAESQFRGGKSDGSK